METAVDRIADYVIGIFADVLNDKPEREKRYEWAVGDPSPKTKLRARLPFDAVWQSRKLIVEVDEDQHRKSIKHFDKPSILTVSGVHRGDQRREYDRRKREAARAHGYCVLEIPWDRRTKRDLEVDRLMVKECLVKSGMII